MRNFRELVFAVVALVPTGRVTTYGRVAAALGLAGKAREVGWALGSIPKGMDLNAHRVVRHDGAMAGGSAFGSPEIQRALLEEEGVGFSPDGRVDLEQHLWVADALEAADLVSHTLDPVLPANSGELPKVVGSSRKHRVYVDRRGPRTV